MSDLTKPLTGKGAALLRPNLDAMTLAPRTPAEKGGAKTQGGPETVSPRDLFAFLRFRPDGSEDPDFVLNRPGYRGVDFLVTGANFGCGSAREHAVWALVSFGIRCVVAPSFGPLFYGNCFKNGVVPVELPEADVQALASDCDRGGTMTLDLAQNRLVSGNREYRFALPAFRKQQLLERLDEIEMSLRHQPRIDRFLADARTARPWLYAVQPRQ